MTDDAKLTAAHVRFLLAMCACSIGGYCVGYCTGYIVTQIANAAHYSSVLTAGGL